MAESGIKGIGVDLIKDSIEVISNCPNSDSWSLGCDITIDDANAELQEIRVADIILSGNITTGEIAVDIDSQKEVIDLGVSAIVNGINSALTESQIVPYDDILKITTISPEATNETRYASSAFSAKAIYDLITFLGRRVDTLESTNEQGGVINKDVADRLDKLEKNQFFERYDDQTIKTKYNLFSDHEISAFGLNAGTGGGSGGEGGASFLKDLWDVTIVSAANNDILVYNGTHWVNKPQSSIMPDLSVLNNYLLKTDAAELYLVKDAAKDFASVSSVTDLSDALAQLSETYGNRLNALEKIVQWFHLTQDEQAIYTEKNFYSEKEISAHGLNLGGGSGEGGTIELGNIIGVSLHSPVTGDVFVYNGTHWTNISQSELVPDLSGYATTDSVSTVSNKVKSLEDRLNDLESEKFFFKLEGADDVIYTPYNLFSEKEISAHGLNYGSGSGASGLLTDLLDVKAENSTSGDLLVFDGTHWINTPQSAIVPSIDTSVIATRDWVGQNYASTSDLSNGVKDAKAYTDALRRHVNEQDQILSGQISKILDWFTLEDGVLLTKYNLASEKEVSAKGINASQGGGTSYNRLDSWSAYDSSKAGYVLSALLGYDLHSRVTTLENAEVDLSGYYTKEQTDTQISSALVPLQNAHDTLRTEFDTLSNLLSSDTSDYINTWNEVVAFLDGYKDESDLATILSGMNADISSRLLASDFESWKTNTFTPLANLVANHTTKLDSIDASITNINTRLEGVDKTIEDHIAEFIAFRANFEISDDLILVRKNFASTEEVSAKGINQGTGGGGGSSYSRLDTWEGYDSNKAGYVLSAGLGYGLKVAVDELEGYDLNNRVSTIENSYVSKDASGVINGGLVVSSLAIAGGTSSQFLKADGSLDGTSYLSTSGGMMKGDVTLPLDYYLRVEDSYEGYVMLGHNDSGILVGTPNIPLLLRSNGVATINGNTILHTGNIGSYAMQYYGTNMPSNIVNYVGYGKPAEGWDNFGPAISFGAGAYYAQMQMASNGSICSRVSWEGSNSDWKTIAFTDSDITGNAATATVAESARTLLSAENTNLFFTYPNLMSWSLGFPSYHGYIDGADITFRTGYSYTTAMLINPSGNVTIGDSDSAGGSYKLYIDRGRERIAYDLGGNIADFISHQHASQLEVGRKTDEMVVAVAMTNDHYGVIQSKGLSVTSTGKLAINPMGGEVYIGSQSWGSFNPTMTVGANVLIGTTTDNGAKLQVEGGITTSGTIQLAHITIDSGNDIYSDNGLFIQQYGSGDVDINYLGSKTILNRNGGNVGIGTSNPQYRLDVAGDVGITSTNGYLDLVNGQVIGNATLTIGVNGTSYAQIQTSHYGVAYTCPLYINPHGGNVGIGTSLPSETLDVDGNTRVRGDIVTNQITIGGATLSWENGALKVNTSFYSEKEISAKGLSTGGGSGASYNRLDTWGDYDSSKSGYVLSALLGYDLNSRLTTVESNYLSKNGGVATNLTVRGAGTAWIHFEQSDFAYGSLGINSEHNAVFHDTTQTRLLLHTGNIGDYAMQYYGTNMPSNIVNYVGYGKTPEGWDGYGPAISFGAGAYYAQMQMASDGSIWSRISWEGSNSDWKNLAFAEDVLSTSGGTIGGSLTVDSSSLSPLLINTSHSSGIGLRLAQNHTLKAEFNWDIYAGTYMYNHPSSSYIGVKDDGTPHYNGNLLIHSGNISSQSVAYATNAGSATKLATSRTIWGQSFDGTDRVGGNLSDVTYLTIRDYDYGIYKGNYFGSLAASDIVFHAPNLYFYTSRFSMLINSSGNVTIGAGDLAGTSAKLYVDGDTTINGSLSAGATTLSSLTVSGLSTFTGGVVAYDIHGNGQSLYLGNASNNAYIKVREDMVGSSSMWSIPRDGKATFTSLTTPTLSVTGSATIASVTIDAGNATLSNLTVNTVATLKQLVVGIDGMSCNAPATFNDFIYGSSITPRTDNYYVLGNNNYKWYAVTAYNVNVHDAITIEAGKELRFKDDNGVVHTLKYDSTKRAFVFDGNVNATGEMSAKKLNA